MTHPNLADVGPITHRVAEYTARYSDHVQPVVTLSDGDLVKVIATGPDGREASEFARRLHASAMRIDYLHTEGKLDVFLVSQDEGGHGHE